MWVKNVQKFSTLSDARSIFAEAHSSKGVIRYSDAELHAVAVHEKLRVGAYCNDGHSCCDTVELGPRVEVLLDLRSHRKLTRILCPAIILESIHNASASLPAAYTSVPVHCICR